MDMEVTLEKDFIFRISEVMKRIGMEENKSFARFCKNWILKKQVEGEMTSGLIYSSEEADNYESLIHKLKIPYIIRVDSNLNKDEIRISEKFIRLKEQHLRIDWKFVKKECKYWNIGNIITTNLINSCFKLRSSNFTGMNIYTPEKRVKMCKSYLKKLSSIKAEILLFHHSQTLSDSKCIKIGVYLSELRHILPKITTKVVLHKFIISRKSLRSIFYLCQDKQELGFFQCKIELETVPNFLRCLKHCTIGILDLSRCGKDYLCNWNEKPEHFRNLMIGLSQAEWAYSVLKAIIIERYDISEENLAEALKDLNLGHLSIVY
ncbi:unnamed protein product [Moneuplotes crassus]|uniref:Uncharacterized protein n=1 Tax=Euplotes crassus TaxID=5936 RepID=A0AAD2CZS2_EUPCR|nr:unnamed protein product [Moneuplotes crassus]